MDRHEGEGGYMQISAILQDKGGEVVSVTSSMSVLEVAQLLRQRRIGAVLVKNPQGPIEGVLSERDIIGGLATQGAAVLDEPAHALMTAKVITCTPHDEVQEALEVMTNNRVRHLPVMDAGKLVGMVSIGDLVKARIRETELEAEAMREYIVAG